MSSIRSYTFKMKTPERAWTISLRRFRGRPTVRICRERNGKKIPFSSKIIGDRLIVLLSKKVSAGTLEVDFSGSQFLYFNLQPWYVRFFNYISGLLRPKAKKRIGR